MAILTVDSLTGCSSIPDFIAGASKSIFNQTAAPTSWTKDTTHNNKALRIIGGVDGTALTTTSANQAFTTVLGPKTFPASSSTDAANITVSPSPAGYPVALDQNTQTFTSDTATLSTAQLPLHPHNYNITPIAANASWGPGVSASVTNTFTASTTNNNTAVTGHSHNTTSTAHGHPISDPGHIHPVSNPGPHSHPVSVTQNFAVTYVDVIICSKD
jgi:hypothetical protein